MPSTNPELVEFGFAIQPGTESFMALKAEVLHSLSSIQKIPYEKRACYMQGEKNLRYYNNYAYLNCYMECSANHTFHVSLYFTIFLTFRIWLKIAYFIQLLRKASFESL